MKAHALPEELRTTFEIGMDRWLPEFLPISNDKPVILNLGAGKKDIEGVTPLDADNGWQAPYLRDYDDESVDAVLAFHFMEHLAKDDVLTMLREIERVLKPGGVFNSVTPHYSAEIAWHDLDHKSFWTESTWSNTFRCPYYDGTMSRDWKLQEHCVVIMGIVGRNLALVSQLVKGE